MPLNAVSEPQKRIREPYFATEYGNAFLGDSSELMAELPDGSVNLVVTFSV
jgi:site-specific DNA-methyltransferase (cytosine-N4-specific)